MRRRAPLTCTLEVGCGRAVVTGLGEKKAPVVEQAGLPDRVSVSSQQPERAGGRREASRHRSGASDHGEPHHLGARAIEALQACTGGVDLSKRVPHPSGVRERPGECPPGVGGASHVTSALRYPNRSAQRPDRPGVAELVLGEPQRMQRGGFRVEAPLGPRPLKRLLGSCGGEVRVVLHGVVRAFCERERRSVAGAFGHRAKRCIKGRSDSS